MHTLYTNQGRNQKYLKIYRDHQNTLATNTPVGETLQLNLILKLFKCKDP